MEASLRVDLCSSLKNISLISHDFLTELVKIKIAAMRALDVEIVAFEDLTPVLNFLFGSYLFVLD
jgi:hypothetical protein